MELMKLHNEMFWTCGIFFIKNILFFLTVSRKIYFTDVNHLVNCTVPEYFKYFKEVYQYYLQPGLRIAPVHADGNFDPLNILIESLPGGPLVNLASANKHVPDIKQRISVVKEWCRANLHGLTFQKMSNVLNTHIVLNSVKIPNIFPTQEGISYNISPKISCQERIWTTKSTHVFR